MRAVFVLSMIAFFVPPASFAEDGERLLRADHYVAVQSTVPSMAGQTAQIYVREVVSAGAALRNSSYANRVVLFIHGAGTPAEVAFDAPYKDYSWMAYLAAAGFDVFAMDTTGYGRSTRPFVMNDACNLSRDQQLHFIPDLIPAACTAPYAKQMTTIASDWNDIGAVVDHILALRHIEKVSLVAWSLGGPRAGGYAAQHPEKVRSLVLLAPAYNRAATGERPVQVPASGVAMNTQSHDEFTANWKRQAECANQYDGAVDEAVWKSMTDSDPVGATWGTGVRRAPSVTTWGWNSAVVTKMSVPLLAVSGASDKQVSPARVRDLVADIGSKDKVFADLACSSHNAAWEGNHLLLFAASLEWLTKGTVNGLAQGTVRLGY